LPACAVTNSHYLLYLNQFPLELSLELYANGASCCLPGPILDPAGGSANLGTDFEVSEVEFKADLLVLDSGIVDAIDKELLAGTALNMPLRCWSQAMHPISATGGAFSQNITRAYSKLKSCFITFRPTLMRPVERGYWNEVNQFTCHHGGSTIFPYVAPVYSYARDQYRMQVSIGSVLYPAVPIRSTAEQYSQMVKAVGAIQEQVGISIGPTYRSTAHIAAIDLEKVSAATPAGGKASFTGISTKNSGEIRILYEGVNAHALNSGTAANDFSYYPKEMYICLYYDCSLVLKRAGVMFAD
jgi:hypothetical protein